MNGSMGSEYSDRAHEARRNLVLRDYHDLPFADRNYGSIRGLFETPSRKIIRHESIAFMGEFIGTFSFLYMAFMGTTIALTQIPDPRLQASPEYIDKPKLLMIALSFGFALMTNVFIWFRVTGGQFNPAVSLALCIMGAIKPGRLATCVVAQITAAIVAAFVVNLLTPGPLAVTTALALTVSSKTSVVQGFFIEMLGTTQLILTIFFTAGEKSRVTPMAPLVIGFSLVSIHLMAANYTGSGVNPARVLGPAIIAGRYENLWLYIFAPLVGSLHATGIYALVKWAGYQDVNRGQDAIQASDADYVLPIEKDNIGSPIAAYR